MRVINLVDIPAEGVDGEARDVKIRWLITEDMGAPNFVMRHFEIAMGGYTPLHKHPWEHEVFVLGGEGAVVVETVESRLRVGDVVFIPGNETHQFKNTGERLLTMLCMIPARHKYQR